MDTGALMTQLKTRLGLPAAATYQTILDAVDSLLQAGTNQEVDQAVAAGRIHSSKRAWWRDKLNAEPAAARLALHSQPAGVIQHETGSHGTPEGTISRVCNALQSNTTRPPQTRSPCAVRAWRCIRGRPALTRLLTLPFRASASNWASAGRNTARPPQKAFKPGLKRPQTGLKRAGFLCHM